MSALLPIKHDTTSFIPRVKCFPKLHYTSQCHHLLPSIALRLFAWMILILGSIVNSVFFLYVIGQRTKRTTRLSLYSFVFSDSLMMMYICIIIFFDTYSQGVFSVFHSSWMPGSWCLLAGIFALFSYGTFRWWTLACLTIKTRILDLAQLKYIWTLSHY